MISIIMPVRNAAPYLRDCIDSILAQDADDWELLAVDDHSSDTSALILTEYSALDSRIRILPNIEKGIIPALKLAYNQSVGELITRMDADDIMPPEKLGQLAAICKNREKTVATGKVLYFSEQGIGEGYRNYANWLNSLIDNHTHWQQLYRECVIPSPCWMMRRKDFESIGAFDQSRYPEDYDLVFRIYRGGLLVQGSSNILHHWRDHGERASRNDPNYADNRFLDLKLRYFIELELTEHRTTVLWGAGKKGKQIARALISQEVEFLWITDTKTKVGVAIAGKTLRSSEEILSQSQDYSFIIAVANPDEQAEISSRLKKEESIFWFC